MPAQSSTGYGLCSNIRTVISARLVTERDCATRVHGSKLYAVKSHNGNIIGLDPNSASIAFSRA